MNNIWPLRQGWLLPNKKTNENGHFAPPSGIQMIFSVDLDIKFLMKKSAPPSGMLLPWRRGETPDGGVALTQREELKFLAGINHNTPFVFMHGINIIYDINSLQGIALVCPGKAGTSRTLFIYARLSAEYMKSEAWSKFKVVDTLKIVHKICKCFVTIYKHKRLSSSWD